MSNELPVPVYVSPDRADEYFDGYVDLFTDRPATVFEAVAELALETGNQPPLQAKTSILVNVSKTQAKDKKGNVLGPDTDELWQDDEDPSPN